MAIKKGTAVPAPTNSLEIGSLFEAELQALNEDLRRQAALTMFYKLHPSNKVNVEQFINGIKQHKDVWSVVSTMGVVDFAEAVSGSRAGGVKAPKAETKAGGKRTRLNENQKSALKSAIIKTLSDNKDGLNRNEIAKAITAEQLSAIGVDRAELANKLRQPLGELVGDTKIHTVGEKRLMKYLAGGRSGKKN